MIDFAEVKNKDFETIPVDSFWNTGDEREMRMHRIHSYPAKFPAFITTKALQYAKAESVEPKRIADIFCGCGTVAYEARRNGIDFWGCDINPVATLIARAKSRKYKEWLLKKYLDDILSYYSSIPESSELYARSNERLRYWYDEKHHQDLTRLRQAILSIIPRRSVYRDFFLCAFSNILKATSRWLTKSIKPQVDPEKSPADVESIFCDQCNQMIAANRESDLKKSSVQIVTGNVLSLRADERVDLIITSPPYVTSYEYADLHQLSSLWLDFADDYRDLREGSIGSLHHVYNFDRELKRLNSTGSKIVFRLIDQHKSKARHVAKYFLDMQQVAHNCHSMLSPNGMALFVIGNTEYKGVRVDNAKHLAESLNNAGFQKVLITKRKISKKILTPYRDHKGCFTTDKSGRKVYSEEFIIIGRK